ncbi:hypothetical protein HYALB_00003573 [Hymenoscyphus albidus]|uniref:Zn(2)-C6 fungal-type domain-containing protein n=1 Tax=Hymenoscyphus albidus TaxID=595503 RepID=A0A9N9QCB7_9HELO|nr:hypothetical protein HYALB_00003573 [Hymenoscyphus albidus]
MLGGTNDTMEIDSGKPKKGKQGAPRKRVSQACDRCRSRKDKCNGGKPSCSTCVQNGSTCSYDANVKKRGLPEGYVRGLERLWGLAIREVQDVEENMLEALNLNGAEAGKNNGKITPLKAWNDETSSENLVKIWRTSQLSQELERLLSSLEPVGVAQSNKRKRLDSDVQLPEIRKAVFGSPPATPSPAIWEKQMHAEYPALPDNDHNGSVAYQNSRENGHVANELRDQTSILTPSHISNGSHASQGGSASNEIPELPSETWNLLDVYFSYTHPWLPIIEKHDLLRTSYQYSQSHNSLGSGDHAALWAVIAFAKFQHRAINKIPRAQGSVREMVWTAERIYSHARTLIPNEEGNFELGHVQALLILTLANMGTGEFSRAWSLIGQAVRAAIDLELDTDAETIVNKPKSRSKHVYLGCFVLDTLVAARLRRRPHLRSQDIDLVGGIDEDGLEEWDPWTDCLSVRKTNPGSSRVPSSILSTFNRLVQVLQVLNEVICTSSNAIGTGIHASTKFLEKLHAWSQRQPSPLYSETSFINSEKAIPLLPHHYHLHTAYFATLAKSQMLAYNPGQENVSLEPSSQTARQISELLKRYSDTFGLLIVPPTYEYFVKSAYDIVSEVRGSIENTHIVINDWKHNLDICLNDMEPAWSAFDSLRGSVIGKPSNQARRQSEVAFDLINGMNSMAEGSASVQTPQSAFEVQAAYSPQFPNFGGTTRHRTPSHQQPPAQKTPTFGASSGPGLPLPPMYQDVRATLRNSTTTNQTTPTMTNNHTRQASRLSFTSSDVALDPIQSNASVISDNDTDPLANEFAALDAMEWSGNWDQSLLNLGFTDRANMNQDFYSFCQEPDPLQANNVFQQLVANSNAEVTTFFDGSALGNMSTDPGRGFVTGDENEGIEAGQILQALSAAEEPIGTMMDGR